MPAHHNGAFPPRQPLPRTSGSSRPQRLPVPPSDEPTPAPSAARRKSAPRAAREPARDLAAAALEPAFLPARGDAAVVAVRDRIAAELVKTHDLSPAALPPGASPDLDGASVRVTAARLCAAPLAVRVPFAGVGWTALLRRADWSERGTASLVYELSRPAAVRAEGRE